MHSGGMPRFMHRSFFAPRQVVNCWFRVRSYFPLRLLYLSLQNICEKQLLANPFHLSEGCAPINRKLSMIRFYLFFLMLTTQACGYFEEQQEEAEPNKTPIARVGAEYLYKEDLDGLVPKRSTPEDSANIMGRYVNTWIRKQLMLENASQNLQVNEAEIERKIQDYRYQLIVHAYEQAYIRQNLDTAITEEEIEQYYQENIDNFQLKQNIVKGRFLKVPSEAPRLKRAKKWIMSNDVEDGEKLLSYARTFSDAYLLEDSIWISFDDFIGSTPFKEEITNPVNTLRNESYLETVDSTHTYMIRIKEYKIQEQVSPLPFVKDHIRNILVNRRAVELKRKHENEVFENATKKDLYEIF